VQVVKKCVESGLGLNGQGVTERVMLVSSQITNRILGDAQRLTKKSLEIRHDCRNTMCISRVLRELLQDERKSRPSRTLGTLFNPNNQPKGTA
jgi:hypothetical protein